MVAPAPERAGVELPRRCRRLEVPRRQDRQAVDERRRRRGVVGRHHGRQPATHLGDGSPAPRQRRVRATSGRPDIATNDFDSDAGFNPWLNRMKSTFRKPTRSVTSSRSSRRSSPRSVSRSAEEQTGVQSSANDVKVDQPVAQATGGRDARAGWFGSARAGAVREPRRRHRPPGHARAHEGWAVGQIPAETGLPDPGVLVALSGLSG